MLKADAMYGTCAPYDPKIYYLDTEQLADGVSYAEGASISRCTSNVCVSAV